MVKLNKNSACGGLSDGIPSHVVQDNISSWDLIGFPKRSQASTAIISTCLFHTISGRGKREVHVNWSMVMPVTGTTLRNTGPVPADSR